MKKNLFFVLFLILLAFGSTACAEPNEILGVQPGNAYLPAGTNIAVELINPGKL